MGRQQKSKPSTPRRGGRFATRTRSVSKADFRDGRFGSQIEAIMARALLDAIAQLKRGVLSVEVQAALRESVTAAIQALDELFRSTDIAPIVDFITQEVIKAGRQQVPELPTEVRVGYTFDARDVRAEQWARARAGRLIQSVQDEVRTRVGDIVGQVFSGDLSLREARAAIERSVGLHDRWQKAVDNSYDEILQQLIDSGVDPDEAEELAQEAADKYADKLRRSRATNIARTEIATAQNQGRFLGWQQAAEQGLFDPLTTLKEWRTAPEFVSSKTEVCPICEPMDGVRVPVFAEFDEVGVVMPPAHPNCRCRAVLIVQPIEDVISQVQAAREVLGLNEE